MTGMVPGDGFTMTILRDGDAIQLSDCFNPPEYYWLFPRSAPAARIMASRNGNRFDISLNRLCGLRLLLHRDMIDFTQPVKVSVNGMEIFNDTVSENKAFTLENFRMNLDRERPYTAELVLDLPELLPPLMWEHTNRE